MTFASSLVRRSCSVTPWPGQLRRWAHFSDMQEATTTTWRKRIERPLGVYFMTGYDFMVLGLLPLLMFVFYLRNSDTEMSLPATMLSVGLYVLVMAFSVWACVGDNIGRWLLLAAVTVTAVMWIVNAIFILSNMDLVSGGRSSVIGFMPRGVMALALNWWYFNRKTTVAYYKRNASSA